MRPVPLTHVKVKPSNKATRERVAGAIRGLDMGGGFQQIMADVRIGLEEMRRRRAAGPQLSAEANTSNIGAAVLMLALFVVVGMYGAEAEAQAKTIRELRSVMRNLMQPSVQLAEVAPNETPYLEFMGRACSDDCSGHLAGWKWASRRDITKEEQCAAANSDSFIDGCRVYLWQMGYAPEPPGAP